MKDSKSIFISRSFYPIEGGIQTFLLEVCKRYGKNKTIVFTKSEKDIESEISNPVKIKRFDWRNRSYFNSLLILLKLLLKSRFSIVKHFFLTLMLMGTRSAAIEISDFTRNVYLYLKRERIFPKEIHASVPIYSGVIGLILKYLFSSKLIVYIHGSELLTMKRKNITLIQDWVFKNSDLIIANSNYTKNLAVQLGVNKKKIEVVNLGANTSTFFPTNNLGQLREKYDISSNHKILYTISHLIPRKGNDMVLKALPKVLERFPNITYLIGGHGRYKAELDKIINDLNLSKNVKFTGFIDNSELNSHMNLCDIFIMPNRREGNDIEGYGIVFMEANACRKPVIGGNSGGVPDAIIDNYNGLLVNPRSSNDISNKIIKLLSNERKARLIGDNGYNLIIKERNWDIVSQKIIEVIKRK